MKSGTRKLTLWSSKHLTRKRHWSIFSRGKYDSPRQILTHMASPLPVPLFQETTSKTVLINFYIFFNFF